MQTPECPIKPRKSSSDNLDEMAAHRHLSALGLCAERFPGKDTRRPNATPDFMVTAPDGHFFFCEQKSVYTRPGNDGILHRTINNSLTDNIHSAARQFNAVNSKHLVPNVLFWVSHHFQVGFHNLVELLTGAICAEGRILVDLTKYRFGRAAKDIGTIDLHIWLPEQGAADYLLTASDSLFQKKLCRAFGIEALHRMA